MPFTATPSTIRRIPPGLHGAPPPCLAPCHRGRTPFSGRRTNHTSASASVASLANTPPARPLYLGLDFGTSGARAAVIDDEGRLVQDAKRGYGEGAQADWAAAWSRTLFELISSLEPAVRSRVVALALDGTSATALLVDPRDGTPLAPPKMYYEAQDGRAVEAARAMAPPSHTATAPSSTLCKLLSWWLEEEEGQAQETQETQQQQQQQRGNLAEAQVIGPSGGEGGGTLSGGIKACNHGHRHGSGWRRVAAARGLATPGPSSCSGDSSKSSGISGNDSSSSSSASSSPSRPTPLLLHQADWLAALLYGMRVSSNGSHLYDDGSSSRSSICSLYGASDWNNALKLGYDPEAEAYPDWLAKQPFAPLLPARVVAPGSPLAPVSPAAAAAATGLHPDCLVCGGTTDSIAAFVAAGVTEAGQAVTSLGSTLAVKLLSTTRVDDAAYGVYSHRLGDVWLVGGASNSGGAVLRSFFTDQQLKDLTPALDPERPTGLSYYPLLAPGERFPVADPDLQPRMSPRPEDDAVFLQGLLEGISQIEADAYSRLAQMGASPLKEVLTAGGGAANTQWARIRQRLLGVPVRAAEQGEACYGAALLARQGARRAAEARTRQ